MQLIAPKKASYRSERLPVCIRKIWSLNLMEIISLRSLAQICPASIQSSPFRNAVLFPKRHLGPEEFAPECMSGSSYYDNIAAAIVGLLLQKGFPPPVYINN